MKSGDSRDLRQWFTSPVPPKNVNLNFPETAPIKEAFANPNDKGVQ
jgi:glutamate/aspartate transport system substrate-binding protein